MPKLQHSCFEEVNCAAGMDSGRRLWNREIEILSVIYALRRRWLCCNGRYDNSASEPSIENEESVILMRNYLY